MSSISWIRSFFLYKSLVILTILFAIKLPAFGAGNSDKVNERTKYTFADLEILEKQQNYHEFFEHALDIRPSKRNKTWTEMVVSMGQGLLDKTSNNTVLAKKDLNLIYQIAKWPPLRDNEFFIKKRDIVFLKEIQSCFQAPNQDCISLSKKIHRDFKHSKTFEFDLVGSLAKYNVPQDYLWQFSKGLASNKLSEFYCGKSPFKDVVLDQVYLMISQDQVLNSKIHPDCLRKLVPELKLNILSLKKYQRDSSFKALAQIDGIKKEQKQKYLLLKYLEEKDLKEDELNSSLEELKALSQNFKLRENLLQTLKALDPLPGKIFSYPKNKQKLIQAKILNRNFPEFIDLYAKECLSYLSGEKTFLNGNPTPYCHGLFAMAEKIPLLPESVKKRYKKATYFIHK